MSKKEKFTILIPNGTGPSNIGDQAILFGLISLLKKAFNNPKIILHSSEPDLYKERLVDDIDHHLYDWSVFDSLTVKDRITRISVLFSYYWMYKLNNKIVWGPKKFKKLIKDYKNADLIVFVGGGYFRSLSGLTQSLNLLMIISIFQYSKLFGKSIIVTPFSFGPFAYKWQEKLTAKVLKDLEIVSVRESISYQKLKKYLAKNLILSNDLAFLIPTQTKKISSNKKPIIGFTIRNWLDKDGQKNLEQSYAAALIKFAQKYSSQIQPIVQVNAEKYGEFDLKVTQNVCLLLKKYNYKALEIKRLKDIKDAVVTYSKLDILLGMRMHSAIIAATQNEPFVAVAYEYKTEGVIKDLGFEDYVIKCENVNAESLYTLLSKAYQTRLKLTKTIAEAIVKLQRKETDRWVGTFRNYQQI